MIETYCYISENISTEEEIIVIEDLLINNEPMDTVDYHNFNNREKAEEFVKEHNKD